MPIKKAYKLNQLSGCEDLCSGTMYVASGVSSGDNLCICSDKLYDPSNIGDMCNSTCYSDPTIPCSGVDPFMKISSSGDGKKCSTTSVDGYTYPSLCNQGSRELSQGSMCYNSNLEGKVCREGNWVVAVVCPVPPHVENAFIVVDGDTPGSEATYFCAPLDRFEANSLTLTCQDNGEWTNIKTLQCKEISCGSPPDIPDTIQIGNETTLGSTVLYSCHPLTTFMFNTTNITCESGGVWSTPDLQCNVIDCGQPNLQENNTIHVTSTTVGSTATYTCSPLSYFYANSTSVECGVDGAWSDVDPHCTVIDCGDPPGVNHTFANSTADYDATTVGSIAHYKCQPERYFVAVPSFSTCGQDSQWGTVTCQEYTCPPAPVVSNADVDVEVLGPLCRAVYECNEGFEGVASMVRFAEGSLGAWNGTRVICQEWECPMPPLIAHASVLVTQFTYKSEASYSCSYQYVQTGGNNTKHCSADRTWAGDNIVCEAVACPVPDSIPNTTVSFRGLEVGGYAHYVCKEGMVRTLDSVNVIYCQENATWEQASMTCIDAKCGPPLNLSDVVMEVNDTLVGSKVIYRYQDGSVAESYCLKNMTWSPLNRQQNEKSGCGILLAPGLVPVPASAIGTAVNFKCAHGFSGRDMVSTLVICEEGGQWSQVPACKEMVCDLPRIDLPLVYTSPSQPTSNVTLDSVVRYGCERGFYLFGGHENRTCFSNGLLDGVQPECERIVCPSLELPPLVDIETLNASIGGSASFSCEKGYNLSHADPVVCSDAGEWVGEIPECLVVVCDVPPVYPHTKTSHTTLDYDSIATYVTEEGYEFDDNSTRVELRCSTDGVWQGGFPGLNLIACADLIVPSMTSIKVTSTTVGGQVTYQCEDVTSLIDGNKVRECLTNGSWSGQATQCAVAIDRCGAPPEYNHASWSMPPYSQGRWILYKCFRGFQMTLGSEKKLCLDDKRWEEDPIICTDLPEFELSESVSEQSTEKNQTGWQLFLKSWGFTDSDLLANHYAVGLSSAGFSLIPLILLLCLDLPHYRDHYKRLFKRNIRSYWRHLRRKTHPDTQ